MKVLFSLKKSLNANWMHLAQTRLPPRYEIWSSIISPTQSDTISIRTSDLTPRPATYGARPTRLWKTWPGLQVWRPTLRRQHDYLPCKAPSLPTILQWSASVKETNTLRPSWNQKDSHPSVRPKEQLKVVICIKKRKKWWPAWTDLKTNYGTIWSRKAGSDTFEKLTPNILMLRVPPRSIKFRKTRRKQNFSNTISLNEPRLSNCLALLWMS